MRESQPALVITLKTSDPETMKAQIIMAINRAMRNHIIAKDDDESLLALIHLQAWLMKN